MRCCWFLVNSEDLIQYFALWSEKLLCGQDYLDLIKIDKLEGNPQSDNGAFQRVCGIWREDNLCIWYSVGTRIGTRKLGVLMYRSSALLQSSV